MTPQSTLKTRNYSLPSAASRSLFDTAQGSAVPMNDGRAGDSSKIEFALNYYRHLDNLRVYVDSRWNEPIVLADAAAAIGISSSRLSYIFHERTGVRFSDWIRQSRVARAKDLLRSNDMSICDVAYSVGFRNTRSFERAFKKTCGLSASKYRKVMLTELE